MKKCFCGARYVDGRCPKMYCPREQLGRGAWHKALTQLQTLESQGLLNTTFPGFDLRGLEKHVERNMRRMADLSAEHMAEERRARGSGRVKLTEDERSRMQGEICKHESRQREERGPSTWRKPRQQRDPQSSSGGNPEGQSQASRSAGGNPAKHKPAAEEESHSDAELTDGFTVLDSDDSAASIFGLRSALHEIEDCDELSDQSSQEDDFWGAEKERVAKWRAVHFLLDERDFAFVFTSFEEAYANAGRAVAMAWRKARIQAEPEMVLDAAKSSAVDATATKIRKVDEQRKAAASKKSTAEASSLRHPGREAEADVKCGEKERFIEPLAQLMMDCKYGHKENSSAEDEEIMDSLRRKAAGVVAATETPTLHRAVTTADELRKYLENRETVIGLDEVEPMVLEEFLWQSRAETRATNGISWLCRNLRLAWPLDKVDRPDTRKGAMQELSARNTQEPVVQPDMVRALEGAMTLGAVGDDPTWLALLASWLHALANLNLGHVIRRSVPVELFAGWMLFFCKRGKQKHDRAGFYWGAPSETTSGYGWTTKFLEAYNRKRDSDAGKEMMSMIFRTDTANLLSAKEVKALTMKAVASNLGKPEGSLAAYSWKRLLPTLAAKLQFQEEERKAIGDWKYVKGKAGEVTTPLRYKEGKEGQSRTCKVICVAALSILADEDINTFDEVSTQRWEELAKEARAKAEGVPMEVKSEWRNPDVTGSGGGHKVKKSQMAFPRQLAGVPLSPNSRDGRGYCAEFQYGKCKDGDDCQLGLHKCAAVFKSGRTCHGNHPGAQCRTTKKHASCEGVDPQEGPVQKKVKFKEEEASHTEKVSGVEHTSPETQPAAKKMPRDKPTLRQPGGDAAEVLVPVNDDSIMTRLLPELRKKRFARRGHRLQPEPPRLVAKVCVEEGRGELWLGPLPTEQRMERIRDTKPSIQICCFAKPPTRVEVEEGEGEWGMFIPETAFYRCEMSNPERRSGDVRGLIPCLYNSLRQGDNAYVHCVSGLSRAPLAAALQGAVLMGTDFERAQSIVSQVRQVKFNRSESRMLGPWMDTVLRERVPTTIPPQGFSCRGWEHKAGGGLTRRKITEADQVVHATVKINGEIDPICRWRSGDPSYGAQRKESNSNYVTVRTIEEAASQFGGQFCRDCKGMLKASMRLQVEKFF